MSFAVYPDYFQPICACRILCPDLAGSPPDPYSLDYPDRLPEWLTANNGEPVPPGAD